jgi:hypothetical protein
LISSLRYRANDFGIGLTSLLNILKQLLWGKKWDFH